MVWLRENGRLVRYELDDPEKVNEENHEKEEEEEEEVEGQEDNDVDEEGEEETEECWAEDWFDVEQIDDPTDEECCDGGGFRRV
jgi:hypothetical protein